MASKPKTIEELRAAFYDNPYKNPRTDRVIEIGKGVYKKLVEEFGDPFQHGAPAEPPVSTGAKGRKKSPPKPVVDTTPSPVATGGRKTTTPAVPPGTVRLGRAPPPPRTILPPVAPVSPSPPVTPAPLVPAPIPPPVTPTAVPMVPPAALRPKAPPRTITTAPAPTPVVPVPERTPGPAPQPSPFRPPALGIRGAMPKPHTLVTPPPLLGATPPRRMVPDVRGIARGPQAKLQVAEGMENPQDNKAILLSEGYIKYQLDPFGFENYPEDQELFEEHFEDLELYLRLATWILYKYGYLADQKNFAEVPEGETEATYQGRLTSLEARMQARIEQGENPEEPGGELDFLQEITGTFSVEELLCHWYLHFAPEKATLERVDGITQRYAGLLEDDEGKTYTGPEVLFTRLYRKYVEGGYEAPEWTDDITWI